MNPVLSTPSCRIGFAITFSLLLHALMMWGPRVELPKFKTELPPLVAKLQAIPTAPTNTNPKVKRQAKPAPSHIPEPVIQKVAVPDPSEEIPVVASSVVSSAAITREVVSAETLAEKPAEMRAEHPPVKV